MILQLNPLEARVIGCLLEKEVTTPDQYPLSLNALTNACNQKSNRDPVLSASEIEVQATLDALLKRHLVSDRSGYGARVPKYRHLFCNTEFGSLKFSEHERAIICELLLRGAQTPGELRAHGARLCRFNDSGEVESALTGLASRADGPFVVRLERSAGEREARYMHLFSGTPAARPELPVVTSAVAAADGAGETSGAVAELERRVAALETALTEARAELRGLRELFDGR